LAEQTCKLCHRVQSEEKGAAAKKGTGILARQKAIQDFMDKHIKEAALKDRAVVEERFRKEGILQHFGPDLPEETPDLRRDSSSSSVATDSTYAADSESSRKKDAKKNISKSSTSKSLKS
jgi:hypothetical protein